MVVLEMMRWAVRIGAVSTAMILQLLNAAPVYYPVYFQPNNPSRLRAFPATGPEVLVPVPNTLSTNVAALGFSSDGRVMYAKTTDSLDRSAGIYKVEFRPARVFILPGSTGMGSVWCLAESNSSDKVTGFAWSWRIAAQGVFEIDPATASHHMVSANSATGCGGGGGVLSRDGSRSVMMSAGGLRIVSQLTGGSVAIRGTKPDTQASWSPDGRWVVCVQNGRMRVVDADRPESIRNLGRSGDGAVVWSPDSRYLLLRRTRLSCALTFYGSSLEVVDVQTGERKEVQSSHCTITAGTLGWLDASVIE